MKELQVTDLKRVELLIDYLKALSMLQMDGPLSFQIYAVKKEINKALDIELND